MISETLEPVDRLPAISVGEVAEALAMTYLAYYDSEPFQPRVLDAYKRAWGWSQIKRFPKVGTTPGFMVGFGQLSYRRIMTVAIEGTNDAVQLASQILSTTNFTNPGPGVTMSVFSFFHTAAVAIKAQLQADNDCAAAFADGSYMFTFTGHSLGAACADIISYLFKRDNPTKPVRLIKFGSPRIGNTFYVNRNTVQIPRISVYCGDDPIHQFPSAIIMPLSLVNVANTALRLNACSEDAFTNLPTRGAPMFLDRPAFTQSSGHFLDAARVSQAYVPGNPWWSHLIKTYRMAMMNMVGRDDDLLKYRFLYLEHNDENTWQSRWSPGILNWTSLEGGLVGLPDPVNPFNAGITPADTATGSVGGGDWGNVAERTQDVPTVDRQIAPTLPSVLRTMRLPRRKVPPVVPAP